MINSTRYWEKRMATPQTTPKLVRFGPFEVDLSQQELRKSGRKIKLQQQPFQVLALLLQQSGQIVEREQLRQAVWPSGTFVEFDRSLNTAIKKIRQALGDSAESPRFIETLPRKGYRFIAPVSAATLASPAPAPPRIFWRAFWVAGSLMVGLGGVAAAMWMANWHGQQPETSAMPVPFTTYPGIETQPSFSPDGGRVAFSWNGEKGDNFDIYVKQIGAEKPVRLTTDPAADSRPAWSPDGRSIAFVRDMPDGKLGILVAPGIGGPARQLTETREASANPRNFAPAWTPDGKWLAFPDRDTDNPADETSSIYALCPGTGEKRRLTHAPAGVLDMTGAFSPDGRSLMFRRWTHHGAELYLLRLSPDLTPAGEPAQITNDGRFASSPAWTRDGREIVYVSLGAGTAGSVWRVTVNPAAKPRRLTVVGNRVRTLALGGSGNRLVYQLGSVARNTWRIELNASGVQANPPVQMVASTLPDGAPAYSPDGRRIAFSSARTGHEELWISAADGADPRPLTGLKAKHLGPPRWSSDGKNIYFDADAAGNFDIYAVEPDGANLRRLTDHPADDVLPSVSSDGQWIYFASKRSGRWEIWKMPRNGGAAVPVTSNGGYTAFESPDGKYIYYAKSAGIGSLWRCPATGGPEQAVAAPVLGNSLTPSRSGIYFARPAVSGGNAIEVYVFTTGKIRTVAKTRQPVYWFLSVSPDQRFLFYSEIAQTGSDLMLLDNLP